MRFCACLTATMLLVSSIDVSVAETGSEAFVPDPALSDQARPFSYVDISRTANMGLTDEVIGDRTGGWTDQGENDLRNLPTGRHGFGGIPFRVIDPAGNGGRSCIVLRGRAKPYFPAQTAPIPIRRTFRYLYVLHGAAWGGGPAVDYARIIVRYEDGRLREIPFRVGREGTDWHHPKNLPGSWIGWLGSNAVKTPIGLQVTEWENPDPEQAVASIVIQSTGEAPVPGFIALTASDRRFARQPAEAVRDERPANYWASLPITDTWRDGPAAATVRRRIPFQFDQLEGITVTVRLGCATGGTLTCRLGPTSRTQEYHSGEHQVRFRFDDPPTLEFVRSNTDDFPISVTVVGNDRIGLAGYDTNPNVHWIPDGQDIENGIYGLTCHAKVRTSNPRWRESKMVQLPHRPRKTSAPPARSVERISTLEHPPDATAGEICLNGLWRFCPGTHDAPPDDGWLPLRVPGTWQSEGYALPDDYRRARRAWYRLNFSVPEWWAGNRLFLRFGGVSIFGQVRLNGRVCGDNRGDGPLPFLIDVTDAARCGGNNTLDVFVDSDPAQWRRYVPAGEVLGINPGSLTHREGHAYQARFSFGGPYDHPHEVIRDEHGHVVEARRFGQGAVGPTVRLFENRRELAYVKSVENVERQRGTYTQTAEKQVVFSATDNSDPRTNGREYRVVGIVATHTKPLGPGIPPGINQDVYLVAGSSVRIENVHVIPSFRRKALTVEIRVRNDTANEQTVKVLNEVRKAGKTHLALPGTECRVPPTRTAVVRTSAPWPDARPWSLSDPWLYFLKTTVVHDGTRQDQTYTRFGFREFYSVGRDFYLNDEKMVLQIANSGWARPRYWYNRRALRAWLTAWKFANYNTVRLHVGGGMNDPTLLEVADEVGFLVHPEFTCRYLDAFWYLFDQWNRQIPGRDEGLKRIYRGLVERDWNHPSAIIWGLQNELITQSSHELDWAIPWMRELGRWMDTVDPTRPATFDGARQVNDQPWMKYATLHGADLEQVAEWQNRSDDQAKPLVVSEIYSNVIPNETLQHRVFAGGKRYWDVVWHCADVFRGQVLALQKRNVAGFCPWVDMPSMVTTPGHLLGERLHTWLRLPDWPALSGPSCKPEYAPFNFTSNAHHVNWYDPSRPKISPNPIYHVIRDTFRPMPLNRSARRPEIVVEVTDGGRPVDQAIVFLRPREGQAMNLAGAMVDPDGRAWFILPEPGRYEAIVESGDRRVAFDLTPEPPDEWGRATVLRTGDIP